MDILKDALVVTKQKSGTIVVNINTRYSGTNYGGQVNWLNFGVSTTNAHYSEFLSLYNVLRNSIKRADKLFMYIKYQKSGLYNNMNMVQALNELENLSGVDFSNWVSIPATNTATETSDEQNDTEDTPEEVPVQKTAKELCIEAMQKLINFFSEFQFAPSFRFVNTLTHTILTQTDEVKNYIHNYFALLDSPYVKEISEKIKSAEFGTIIDTIKANATPSATINKRIKIYYGSAGTGKTTLAQTETDNRCIVCNNSMLPADLMEDFCFENGHPSFNPSLLWDCMEKGLPVVLDEINLLPFDSLRFLQGIVDGKTEFYYKNRAVHIADGFQIIGTMNLTLNGMVYGLPEPLVDRCSQIQEFKLTAEQLYNAVA